MYIVTVPQVTIYLNKELHDAVKAERIPVSEVCQMALRDELAFRRVANTPARRLLAEAQRNIRRQ